jgi:hypothetical protein
MPQATETAAPDAKGMSQVPGTASPDAKGMSKAPETAEQDDEMLSLAPGQEHQTPNQYFIVFSSKENKICAHISLVIFCE